MKHKLEAAPKEHRDNGQCRHHWIIESPKGPTSKGVCQLCGAEQEFDNYGPDYWREGDVSTLFGRPGLPAIEPDGESGDS